MLLCDILAIDAVGNSSVAAGGLKWMYKIRVGESFISNFVLDPYGTLYVSINAFPQGGYISAISTRFSDCPPGFYSPIAKCVTCSPGNFCPGTEITMTPCPQGSPRSIPCPAGTSYPLFNAARASDCTLCQAGFFALSGASACSACGTDETSAAGAETCHPCVPSAFSLSRFNCYSTTAQVLVICGWVLSIFSSLFTIYKFRAFVLERMQKLKAAGIKPTMKRIVFLERSLRNSSKLMLLSLSEHADAAGTIANAAGHSSNEELGLLADFRTQMRQQQQQIKLVQHQLHEHQLQLNQLRSSA